MHIDQLRPSDRTTPWQRFWHFCSAPHQALTDVAQRRNAQLLSVSLLVMTVLFGVNDLTQSITTPDYRVPWGGYLFLTTAYFLSRTRYMVLATALTVAMFPIVIFSSLFQDRATNSLGSLPYLLVGLVFGSIFLSTRALAILALANIVGILSLPLLAPTTVPSFEILITPLTIQLVGTILALVSIHHRKAIERDRQTELQVSQERLHRQDQALLDLAKMTTVAYDDLAAALQLIAETAARTLAVERVGIWFYTDDRLTIRCQELYTERRGQHEAGGELAAAQYPAYFAALETQRTIAAHFAQADRRTHELRDAYLLPLGITSLLDAPIMLHGTMAGVICHEHVGPARTWTPDEQGFVMSLADQVVLALQSAERARTEAALRESEERYRAISEVAADYAFSYRLDTDGSIVFEWITGALTRITGYTLEEVRDATVWSTITHPEDRLLALQRWQRLRAGQSDVSEYRILAKDGGVRWLRFFGQPVYDEAQQRVVRVYGAAQDITQLKHLEQQLLHAQKMEAIGRLAGGIAHDFNNLLTVILGNIGVMLDELDPASHLRRDGEQVRGAAERAAMLTRQLLAFSRRQVLQPQELDLNSLVSGVERMLERLIGEDVQLVTRLAADLGRVRADPGQLEQVIMNLAVNARDAMPNGGTLSIETSNVELDAVYPEIEGGLRSGPHILLTVSDTGYGMDGATQERIFEPFFTTKELGKGTGLGLATVHGIVIQSGGYIWVYSEPGHGATFKIYLPHSAASEPSASAPPIVELPQGVGTILVAEDEPAVLDLVARILRARGYEVLEAADGATALQIAAQHAGAIDLLLTDVIMPGGRSGRQVAEQVLAHRPQAAVLYMSGYSEHLLEQNQMISAQQIVLQKPFTAEGLVRAVWEALQPDHAA